MQGFAVKIPHSLWIGATASHDTVLPDISAPYVFYCGLFRAVGLPAAQAEALNSTPLSWYERDQLTRKNNKPCRNSAAAPTAFRPLRRCPAIYPKPRPTNPSATKTAISNCWVTWYCSSRTVLSAASQHAGFKAGPMGSSVVRSGSLPLNWCYRVSRPAWIRPAAVCWSAPAEYSPARRGHIRGSAVRN